MESRNQKFRRLGASRMTRIFQVMNLIANLSAPQYVYTIDDITELFTTYRELGKTSQEYFQETGPTRYNEMPDSFVFKNQSTTKPESRAAHERFRRLAEKRMSRVVHTLRLLTNLSDRSNYTYSPEEVTELFVAFKKKGQAVEALFAPLETEFSFKNQE